MDLQDLVLRLGALAPEVPYLQTAWLEGEEGPAGLPAPGKPLDLHLGVEEPDLDQAFAEHAGLLGRLAPVESHRDGEADFEGRSCRARLAGGCEVHLTLERMALIGKRARLPLRLLYDRTGRVRGCFTRRRP